MSQDDPKEEEHLHEDQDDVAGTDEPRFGEQQDDVGDETEKPKQGSSDAASADRND